MSSIGLNEPKAEEDSTVAAMWMEDTHKHTFAVRIFVVHHLLKKNWQITSETRRWPLRRHQDRIPQSTCDMCDGKVTIAVTTAPVIKNISIPSDGGSRHTVKFCCTYGWRWFSRNSLIGVLCLSRRIACNAACSDRFRHVRFASQQATDWNVVCRRLDDWMRCELEPNSERAELHQSDGRHMYH